MREVRSPTEKTARRTEGTTTPAGTGASKNVTLSRGSAWASAWARGSVTGRRSAASAARASEKGTCSSPKVSSRASRAPRSGTAKAMEKPSFTSWRTRPRRRVSEPAIWGWRTLSSTGRWAPAVAMDENDSRWRLPKSSSRAAV